MKKTKMPKRVYVCLETDGDMASAKMDGVVVNTKKPQLVGLYQLVSESYYVAQEVTKYVQVDEHWEPE